MSNISSLDSNNSLTSTSVNSVFQSGSSAENKSYNEDQVTLSDEAIELLEELRYKENQTYVYTENQRMFDKVSKALPATESFEDMLNWLSEYQEEDTNFTIGEMGEINRNVYEKDPEKYAELWSNMYNHFTDLMDSLGLASDTTMQREVMSNDEVAGALMDRFTSSFSDETTGLLSYFNITV